MRTLDETRQLVLENSFVARRSLERVSRVASSPLTDSAMAPAPEPSVEPLDEDVWLAGFHEGRREAIEDCYREHFATVDAAVSRILHGADRETVVQEVFTRLMSDPQLRCAFRGGRLTAWLATLSRNLAIDFARRRRFERPDGLMPAGDGVHAPHVMEHQAEVRLLVERFRKERLPPRWAPVFEARFVCQMDQRTAARHVGISRTTLAYQEYRIRGLLRSFALQGNRP
jgi:RNA polymerase sigma-70 factor (ECF subfamily)